MVWTKLLLKIEYPVTCLATMAYCLCSRHTVTIFSTGGKFRLVSTFSELHILTPAACSYTLVTDVVSEIQVVLLEWSHINNVGELYISTMYHSLYDILETERSWSGDCILQ